MPEKVEYEVPDDQVWTLYGVHPGCNAAIVQRVRDGPLTDTVQVIDAEPTCLHCGETFPYDDAGGLTVEPGGTFSFTFDTEEE